MSGHVTEMKASLLLSLEDQLSGGVNRLMEVLDRLIGTTEKLAGGFTKLGEKLDAPFDKARTHVRQLEEQLHPLGGAIDAIGRKWHSMTEAVGNSAIGHAATKIGALGAAGAGISFVEPVRGFAEYENTLRHIAITEHLEGAAASAEIARLTKMFAEDAQRSGQSSESIAKAYYDFATSGLSRDVIDKIIAQHSMAATAYNISAEALGPSVLALIQNMKIPEADIGSAIGAMAEAAKAGRFKIENFAQEFPGVSGMMSLLGMTGRKSADYGFAALETIMKNSSDPSGASAGFVDALRYITDNAGRMAFKRAGYDLHAIEVEGAKHGRNPLDSILDFLAHITRGKNPLDQATMLGGLLHNQQAGLAIQALLEHRAEFETLRTGLDKKDAGAVAGDFNTAFDGPVVKLRLFDENLAQLNRTAGQMFAPTLGWVSDALGGVVSGFDWMNAHFPVLTRYLGDFGGAFLAITAALGAIGFAAPLVSAGASAMVAALTAIASPAVLAGALALAGILSAKWLSDSYQKVLEKMPPDERKAAQNAAAGVTYEWDLPSARKWKDNKDEQQSVRVDIHVTAAPGLHVETQSAQPRLNTRAPFDGTLDQTVGRD